MRLRYSLTATNDIDGIYLRIAEHDAGVAEAMVRRIEDAVRGLQQFPMRGRVGRVTGTRELVVGRSPYVVAYAIRGAAIEILAVLDGRRRWPEAF